MPNNPWQEELESLKRHLDTLRRSGGGWIIPDAAREAFNNFTQSSANDVNRRVYVLGQLDIEKMAAVCREGLSPWWPVFTGRVYAGDLDGLKKVRDLIEKDAGKSDKPNMSSALTWIVYPHKIAEGFSNKIEPKLIRQLLQWGADANYENGKWLEFALKNLEADGIKPFLDHGAASATILRVMDDLQKNQKFAQLGKIQDALSNCSWVKVDEQTLLESKYVADARGGSMFKTIFNFRSRRVHEIYESGQGAQAVMDGMPFADYDTDALHFAEDKLRQLGGNPKPVDCHLDKPARPVVKALRHGGE